MDRYYLDNAYNAINKMQIFFHIFKFLCIIKLKFEKN